MLKAGALYFSIVIAFFIAVISASLIMLVAHYRNSYLKDIRYQRLLNNVNSGVTLALSQANQSEAQTLDLYGKGTDSLDAKQSFWGIYELVQLQSYIQQDTIKKAFLMGKQPDSISLYLSDEDRPLSISGNTRITGDVQLPKSGLRQAYAEGKPYTGEKLIFSGEIKNSNRELPAMEQQVLDQITASLNQKDFDKTEQVSNLKVSFHQETKQIYLGKIARLENVDLQGRIILVSDSMITISSTAVLADVQVYAPVIRVESGFKGHCQLFASDSLLVSNKVNFSYPSVLAVLRTDHSGDQPKLVIGDEVNVEGLIFSYEKKRSPQQTLVSLGKNTKVKGEVICTGLLKLEKEVQIKGKVACNRFIMKTTQTLYENFLIDVTFNHKARSKYYLSAALFGKKRENKVLKWLN